MVAKPVNEVFAYSSESSAGGEQSDHTLGCASAFASEEPGTRSLLAYGLASAFCNISMFILISISQLHSRIAFIASQSILQSRAELSPASTKESELAAPSAEFYLAALAAESYERQPVASSLPTSEEGSEIAQPKLEGFRRQIAGTLVVKCIL